MCQDLERKHPIHSSFNFTLDGKNTNSFSSVKVRKGTNRMTSTLNVLNYGGDIRIFPRRTRKSYGFSVIISFPNNSETLFFVLESERWGV